MSQIKDILEFPSMYLLSQAVLGAKRARRICVEEYVRPRAGMRVLDIGCGPGYVIDYFPEPAYVGFDIEPKYIEYAERKYGDRGKFYCQYFDAEVLKTLEPFDVVLMTGVIHHLTDQEALDLLALSKKALKKGGRLIALDPCYQEGQSPIAKYLLNNDRGHYIRNEAAYVALASKVFDRVTTDVRHDLFYVPYTKVVMDCS